MRSVSFSSLIRLADFIRPYWKLVAAALLFLLVTAVLSLLLPVAARYLVDGLAGGSPVDLNRAFAFAIVVACLLAVSTACRYAMVTRLGERVVADIRKALFAHVISLSPAFYERTLTGEVLSRLNTDTTLILAVLSSSASIALRNSLILCGGLTLMLATSLKLTLLVLVIVPITVVPALGLARRLKSLSRDNQDRIAEGAAYASEALLAAATVQANTHEEVSQLKFDAVTESYILSANNRILVRALMTAVIIGLSFTGVTVVLWVGARDLGSGLLTPGQLTQFVIYSVMVAGAVSSLSEVWGELVRASGAADRLAELMATSDPVEDGPGVPQADEQNLVNIEFRDVSFCYPMRPDVVALNAVSFKIGVGETVALVGPSGAGKSTIFQLLLRFFDPQSGTIAVDGVDIRLLKKKQLRRKIALVPQETHIFADTARENIRFGWPEASDEEVEKAARLGAVHDFLDDLPDGYGTFVGERGIMLSGGQKQRIAVSRAFLRPSPILLLDEATSSLDAESEGMIQDSIDVLARSRTTLVIAHRLATVRNADRIIVMANGGIEAEGTHDSLVRENGLYARLARLQFI